MRQYKTICAQSFTRLSFLVALCVIFLAAGCGPTSSGGVSQPSTAAVESAEAANALADAVDPTAEHLHDLAGRLLLFRLKTGRMPETLAELDIAQPTDSASGIDPANGTKLIYMPNGPRPAKVPGRLVVVQSSAQPTGRWCLIFRDSSADGQFVTLVQRVPESVFRQISGTDGW